eukprot:Em0009g1221a
MSTVLYIKTNPCETTKTEVTIGNVTVAELSVTALQQAVQAKLGVPIGAQCLVFGGRVLRPGRNLGHYKVSDKSTLYLLPKVSLPEQGESALVPSVQPSAAVTQAQNMLAQLLRDPQFMRSVLQRTPALATDPVFRQLLDHPDSVLSDPGTITRYLEGHPEVVTVLVGMRAGEAGVAQHEEQENMDYSDGTEPPAYANAQEQMYQHSQALHAHQSSAHEQQAAGTGGGSNESTRHHHQQATAEPHPGVTRDDLVSALAGVVGTGGNGAQGRPTPAPRLEPVQATTGGENSQQVGTLSSQVGTIYTGQPPPHAPQTPQTFTTRYLQRALASALSTTPSAPSPQLDTLQRTLLGATSGRPSQNVGTPSPQGQQERRPAAVSLSERYRIQLNRLHSMGLTDDATLLARIGGHARRH